MKEDNKVITTGSKSTSSNPLSFLATHVEHFFRVQVDNFLTGLITRGSLTFTYDEEEDKCFGETIEQANENGHPIVKAHVKNIGDFYTSLATQSDLGFAEAFMHGDIVFEDYDQLTKALCIFIINGDGKSLAPSMRMSRLGMYVHATIHAMKRNTVQGSRKHISAHYDLPTKFFGTFLGESWNYSSGMFKPGYSLDDAQLLKMNTLLSKLKLGKHHHLLEIGSGWGQLSIHAAKTIGCKVTAITVSEEQYGFCVQRSKEHGVDDKVTFQLIDYRDLAKTNRKFDRVVSVEMLEHVGHEFYGTYFKSIDQVLNKNGVACVQVITIPEDRYESYRKGVDFAQKFIFPGGCCPSFAALVSAMTKDSSLMIEHAENIASHYATTTKEWRNLFMESVKNGTIHEMGYDDIFIRKFIYYFCYAESGFTMRVLNDIQMVLTRSGNVESLGGPFIP